MRREPTEDDYYAMLSEIPLDYGDGIDAVIDTVATLEEWSRCKAAILRWVAEQDEEYDELARSQERGDE